MRSHNLPRFRFIIICHAATTIVMPVLTSEKSSIDILDTATTLMKNKRISGQELPFPKEPSKRDLFVNFDIKLPQHISHSVKNVLYDTRRS